MRRTDVTLKRCRKNLLRAVDTALLESDKGLRRLSIAELKSLSDIMARERPSVVIIQTVLVNQLGFLERGFEGTQAERETVSRFLRDFQADAAESALDKESSIEDGLRLQEGLAS